MLIRLLFIAALAPLPFAAVADISTTLTGCLQRDKGVMYYVQEGDFPMHPCADGDRTISFNQVGPQGPQGPQGPAAQAPKEFRFVGVTTTRFNGIAGWMAMTRACATQYPGSRMATTEEFRATVNPPDISERAWVTPSPAFMALYKGGSDGSWFMDRTGGVLKTGQYQNDLDCRSWTSNGNGQYDPVGLTVTVSGAIQQDDCSAMRPVLCAAPEQ